MIVYPVQQTQLKSGAIASLTRFFDESKSLPVSLETGESSFKSFRLSNQQISISMAAKLDVSAVFKGSFKFDDIGMVFDAVAFTDKHITDQRLGQPVIMTRWGAGMRIAMKVTNVQGDLGVNFGSVAAATELKRARASYEILGLGLGLDALAELLDDLPPFGDFGLDAYSKLTNGAYTSLKNYITNHKNELSPVPLAVGLREEIEIDPIEQARSVYLAAYWRNRRKSLEYVMEKYPDIDSKIVAMVYELSAQDLDRWFDR